MSIPSVKVLNGRAIRSELGDALINPSPNLTSDTLFETAGGASKYLPVYITAIEATGGKVAFEPSLSKDGELIIYMKPVPPSSVQNRVGKATLEEKGITSTLVLNASGGGTRIPLTQTDLSGLSKLTVKLTGGNLKAAQEALYDTNPNVAIEVTQKVKIAVLQSKEFILKNWGNKIIKAGLIDSFGGIPTNSAEYFYDIAIAGDSDYPNQYLVMEATYTAEFAVPPLPGFIRIQVDWNGRAYNYYQDNQNQNRIFYVPEKFEFANGPKGAPSVSLLQFSLPIGANSVKQTEATFRIFGLPIFNGDRIVNAAKALKEKIGQTPTMVSVEDANRSEKTFVLNLPNVENTSSDMVIQQNATINFSEGMRAELKLNFKQFQGVWAAIFSSSPENPIFRGRIDLKLSDGKFEEHIDFDARLPKENQEALFDSILSEQSQSSYEAELSVKTVPVIWNSPIALRELEQEKQVYNIELIFSGKSVSQRKTVELNKDKTESQFTIEQPIRDIILGKEIPDEFPYTLKVICDDGTIYSFDKKFKSDDSPLWITAKTMVEDK